MNMGLITHRYLCAFFFMVSLLSAFDKNLPNEPEDIRKQFLCQSSAQAYTITVLIKKPVERQEPSQLPAHKLCGSSELQKARDSVEVFMQKLRDRWRRPRLQEDIRPYGVNSGGSNQSSEEIVVENGNLLVTRVISQEEQRKGRKHTFFEIAAILAWFGGAAVTAPGVATGVATGVAAGGAAATTGFWAFLSTFGTGAVLATPVGQAAVVGGTAVVGGSYCLEKFKAWKNSKPSKEPSIDSEIFNRIKNDKIPTSIPVVLKNKKEPSQNISKQDSFGCTDFIKTCQVAQKVGHESFDPKKIEELQRREQDRLNEQVQTSREQERLKQEALPQQKERISQQVQINQREEQTLKEKAELICNEISSAAAVHAQCAVEREKVAICEKLNELKDDDRERRDKVVDNAILIGASLLQQHDQQQKKIKKQERLEECIQQRMREENKSRSQIEEEIRLCQEQYKQECIEAEREKEAFQEAKKKDKAEKKELKKKQRENDANRNSNSGPNKDPEKDPEYKGEAAAAAAGVKKKMQYEGNPKHHPNSKESASKPPYDGQKTLEKSIEVPGKDYRVGVEDGQVIKFQEHEPGKYHGYIVEKDLDIYSENALKEAGLMNKRGKLK